MIVVGGGIQGAMMALEGVRRGMHPLLLERDGFGSETSGNSFGIVHGGLRYLQSLDIRRWRQSRAAQNWFQRELGRFVAPMACVMPLYRGALRSPALFRAAFKLERLASRMTGSQASVAPPRLIDPNEVAARYSVPAAGLVGGACWTELVIDDPKAMLAEIVARIRAGGGEAVEGLEVVELNKALGRVVGIYARRRSDGRLVRYRADHVFLCAGSASQQLAAQFDRSIPALSARVMGFNLLLDAPPPNQTMFAVSPVPGRGRSLFVRPFKNATLVGTAYMPLGQKIGGAWSVPKDAIRAFRDEIACALPALADAPLIETWAGRLPDSDNVGRRLRTNDLTWDHSRHGGPRGLVTMMATKLTTAHAHARRVADRTWPHTVANASDRPSSAACAPLAGSVPR